jgi:tetratricopeptide (TPR) repeat protein
MKKSRSPQRRKRRIRVKRVLLTGVLFLCILASLPVLWHVKEIRTAQDRYDFQGLQEELDWVEERTPWLKKIPLIRDSEFWLNLNQGQYEVVQNKLTHYEDDKHKFWLFQIYLLKNQEKQAQNLIQELESVSRRELAEGLFAAKVGDNHLAGEKIRLVADSELNHEEQILKNLSLTRIEMALGNLDKAEEALNKAKKLSPQYPLALATEFDLLLASGKWEAAKQLEVKLEGIPSYSERPDYLIKKALLALTIGELEVWNRTLTHLSELENGDSYREYLTGVESYQLGKFNEAIVHLKKSLEQDLPDQFRKDAEKALAQASERLNAESALGIAKKS